MICKTRPSGRRRMNSFGSKPSPSDFRQSIKIKVYIILYRAFPFRTHSGSILFGDSPMRRNGCDTHLRTIFSREKSCECVAWRCTEASGNINAALCRRLVMGYTGQRARGEGRLFTAPAHPRAFRMPDVVS